MQQKIELSKELFSRYDKAGPRYTSYPTVPQFSDLYSIQDYKRNITSSNNDLIPKPLSLYFHIPFCDTICYYCACSKIITKQYEKAEKYLSYLIQEINLQSELFDEDRVVEQLHWGGGTPTFLSDIQIARLMDATKKAFRLRDDDGGEYSIEIDPRKVNNETIKLLRKLGFNRISLGVQDFSEKVQHAVNRIQPESTTKAIINSIRENNFKSINIDLIYGLPLQTIESFKDTILKVIKYSPDRIAIYNYAHLPKMFPPQRRIAQDDLPSLNEKLGILQMVIENLTDAGYVYIGMDHFSKPDDDLAIAQLNGTLQRNFQGYSAHKECDLIAMGITSIGKIGHSFSQNVKTLDSYYKLLDDNQLPLLKGYNLSFDDKLRAEIIYKLTCYSKLNITSIELDYDIVFDKYFCSALPTLKQMQRDGLITINSKLLIVTPVGRLLLRNIVMVFDNYLDTNSSNLTSIDNFKKKHGNKSEPQFSRLI